MKVALFFLLAIGSAISSAQTWRHSVVKDEMTDAKTFTLSTSAVIPGTKQIAHLFLFCPFNDQQQETESRPDVVDLFPKKLPERQISLLIGTPFILDHSDGDDLLLRFDDYPAEEYSFKVTKDLKTVISMQGSEISEEMIKATRMRVQLVEYPSSRTRIVSFSLLGFSEAIKGHCGF